MGSHKHKKKYESDSSSSGSDASSSSSDSRSKKKKYSKKAKYSSSEESGTEKIHKPVPKSSNDSDREKYKKKKKARDSEERSTDRKYKEKYHHLDNNKDKHEERYKDKDRHNRDRSRDRERSIDRGRSRERGKSKDRGRSGDKQVDETRTRRDYNREKYEDRDRNKRYEHKRDDWSLTDERNSRKHRNEDGGYRARVREDNRDRRNNSQHENRGRRSSSFDHANAKWGKDESDKKSEKKDVKGKEKPNFGLSGKLTEETNTYKGIVIKYSEPPEARKPRRRWRLYPFKGEKALQTLYIHRESAYLIGRERKVVDLPVDHPSCSKQHAALQYRLVPFTRDDGSVGKRVRPYLIDLDSANGTFINNKKIEPKKYVELFEKDVIKFGFSSREYVLLHENSKDEAMDDDVKQEEELPIKEEPQ